MGGSLKSGSSQRRVTSAMQAVVGGADIDSIDTLARSFNRFMKPFLVFIDPIFHSTVWQGKRFTEKHIIVVMAVSIGGPIAPSELSRAFKLQKGSLTTIIRNLCQEGLVERTETVGDERSYRLVITSKGKEFVGHITDQQHEGFRALFAELPEQACQQIVSALEVLIAYLEPRTISDV